ncbi:MAG: hypothetical protein LJU34_04975, partial [Oscillospiraceae bacterium]|nr:hypothetical protein [Oscillospiraceae bacterium]
MKKQIPSREPAADRHFLLALRGIFVLSFCLVGLYYELAAAVVSALLLALLLWKGRKKNKLAIHI